MRCYNPPHFDPPLGMISRDHRKMLAVDGEVGFISGLCVGRMWAGVPEKKVEAWRDTGVEVRRPAAAEIDRAFAQVWAMMGEPISDTELISAPAAAGTVSLRVVATVLLRILWVCCLPVPRGGLCRGRSGAGGERS